MLQEAEPSGLWTGPLVGARVPGRQWGSWVLARHGTLEPIAIPHYAGWVAGGVWDCNSRESIYLFSIHSPTRSKTARRRNYVAEARQIIEAICAQIPEHASLIVAGDFNFRSLGERLPTETLQTTRAELRALREFRAKGLSVVWRETHPTSPLPQTLRWRSRPSVPFHCDGFLARGFNSASMTCHVLSDRADATASDHNPVVLQVLPSRVT
jgi:endonuclease/exonuclease/phosphatase family metal-dependent hydrolase